MIRFDPLGPVVDFINPTLTANREQALFTKGRLRKLKARKANHNSTLLGPRFLPDLETDHAFLESVEIIKELLNLDVSQSVLFRAAVRQFHLSLLELQHSPQENKEEKLVKLLRRFQLRVLLYQAAGAKI